jgi:hypothetical protein
MAEVSGEERPPVGVYFTIRTDSLEVIPLLEMSIILSQFNPRLNDPSVG